MQIVEPHSSPTEPESLGAWHSPPEDSDARSNWRTAVFTAVPADRK